MMIIHALVIAPYRGLVELTASLKEELQDFQITMLQGDLSEVLPMVAQIEAGQYDVIISRGGTARLLRQHVTIPVIDIQVSGYDIMRILTLVKGSQSKVEMIGFPNIIDGFIAVSRIMDIEIPHTVIEHEYEVGSALAKAKELGVSMVLGDTVTVRMAQEMGLEGVLITSGKESVLEAFAQARYMQVIAERYKQKCTLYEQLLNKLDTGFAVFDENNHFQYGNDAFCSQWGISPDNSKGEILERNPNITPILDCMKKGVVFSQVITVCEPLQPFVMSAGEYTQNSGLYYMRMDTPSSLDSEWKVSFSMGEMLSYPLFLSHDHVVYKDSDRNAKGKTVFPIALYGEEGTGKRQWSVARIKTELPASDRHFIEVELLKSGKHSVEGLQNILLQMGEDTVLYLKGIEILEAAHQKSLTAWITASNAQVIVSFDQNPEVLLKDGSLEASLYGLIKNNIVFFPPLREKRENLEALIRSFIAKSNETTGKQIVGIRTSVLDSLLQQPWPRNFIELKDTIDWLVQNSEGEFIDDAVLELLEAHKKFNQVNNGSNTQMNTSTINLNQTLEEIERDVILAVMEEEEMNQSRAAIRLGINRSTLWRKLKQNES